MKASHIHVNGQSFRFALMHSRRVASNCFDNITDLGVEFELIKVSCSDCGAGDTDAQNSHMRSLGNRDTMPAAKKACHMTFSPPSGVPIGKATPGTRARFGEKAEKPCRTLEEVVQLRCARVMELCAGPLLSMSTGATPSLSWPGRSYRLRSHSPGELCPKPWTRPRVQTTADGAGQSASKSIRSLLKQSL